MDSPHTLLMIALHQERHAFGIFRSLKVMFFCVRLHELLADADTMLCPAPRVKAIYQ